MPRLAERYPFYKLDPKTLTVTPAAAASKEGAGYSDIEMALLQEDAPTALWLLDRLEGPLDS